MRIRLARKILKNHHRYSSGKVFNARIRLSYRLTGRWKLPAEVITEMGETTLVTHQTGMKTKASSLISLALQE